MVDIEPKSASQVINIFNWHSMIVGKRRGAVEAHGSHNPGVPRSKRGAANQGIVFVMYLSC